MFTLTKEVATLIQSGAAATAGATKAKKLAAETIANRGGRGYMFTKQAVTDTVITAETLTAIQTLIAKGLFDKNQFALWSTDSKQAAAQGFQKERNALTSQVSTYLASFRLMIETAWAALNPEKAAEEKAEAEKVEPAEKAETAAKVLSLESMKRMIVGLVLEVSGSKDAAVVAKRANLITLLNQVEAEISAK
jgi:hypothetical protein